MGGHVIPNVSKITRTNFQTVLINLKKLIPQGINIYPIGSAGKKEIASDVDVLVDANELLAAFPASKDIKSAKQSFELSLTNQGYRTAKSGVSIHIGIPTGENNDVAQVDIMIVDNAKDAAPLHTHDYSQDPSMKGGTLHAIWADLANMTSYNNESSFINSKGEIRPILMMSPYRGLVNRKTNELITSNKDEIAKLIIGPDATSIDMSSTTRILDALCCNPIKYNEIKNKYFSPTY